MDSEMPLKAVGHHRVAIGGFLFTLFAKVNLTAALLVDLLETSCRKCELRVQQGIDPPGSTAGS